MTNNRTWLVIAAGIIILALAAWFWNAQHRASTEAGSTAAPEVQLATARAGTIDVTVDAIGRIGSSAGSQSKLAFAVGGRLASIDVHVGQRVTAGEALAALDATNLSLAQQQARADATAAQAQAQAASVDRFGTKLAVDRAALARTQRLYAAGISARKDIDAAKAQLASDIADARAASADRISAQAQAQSASARASLASRDASNATLRAPTDGVVTAIYRSAGESVDSTIPVIALSPEQTGAVALQVAGSDAAKIAPGNAVSLHVTGNDNRISGTVLGVASAVDPATQIAEVSVKADVPLALAGSAVSGQIVVGHDHGVIIPHDAIIADPQTGDTLVFIRTLGKDNTPTFTQRKIHIIFQNQTQAEVTGLNSGDKIAAHGAFELLAPSSSGN